MERIEMMERVKAVLKKENIDSGGVISPLSFEKEEGKTLLLSKEVYEKLEMLKKNSIKLGKEFIYLIFGEEFLNGNIILDKIVSSARPFDPDTASMRELELGLIKHISEIQSGYFNTGHKRIICYGHTLPMTKNNDGFTLDDLCTHIELCEAHPLIKFGQVRGLSLVVPACGDINAMRYDKEKDKFAVYPKVCELSKEGIQKELPAYKNGKYSVETQSHIIQ